MTKTTQDILSDAADYINDAYSEAEARFSKTRDSVTLSVIESATFHCEASLTLNINSSESAAKLVAAAARTLAAWVQQKVTGEKEGER